MEKKPAERDVPGASDAPLPAERAFVVQFRAQPDPTGDVLVGRAEHVASGDAARFGSAAELIEFIAKVLARPRGGS